MAIFASKSMKQYCLWRYNDIVSSGFCQIMVFGNFGLRINKIVLSLKVQWYCIKWEVGRGFLAATTIGTCSSSARYYNLTYVTVPRASNCDFLLSILGCCCVCSMKSFVGFLISLMQFYYFYQKRKKKEKRKNHKSPLLYLKMCLVDMPHITLHNFIEEVSKEFKDKDEKILSVVSGVPHVGSE